jgi:hypothetical protein
VALDFCRFPARGAKKTSGFRCSRPDEGCGGNAHGVARCLATCVADNSPFSEYGLRIKNGKYKNNFFSFWCWLVAAMDVFEALFRRIDYDLS